MALSDLDSKMQLIKAKEQFEWARVNFVQSSKVLEEAHRQLMEAPGFEEMASDVEKRACCDFVAAGKDAVRKIDQK